jgi:hypothetical protein
MTEADSSLIHANTSTLDGARYILTVKNKLNKLHTEGSTEAGTPIVCLRKTESGYYVPCAAVIVTVKESGRFTVDLYPAGRIERVTVSPKAVLWPETFRRVQCEVCGAAETLGGEINERTLEDEGWYLGPTQTLCPDHAEQEVA